MTDHTGMPIPPDEAWRTFDGWQADRREVGIIFYGGSGTNVYTVGVIRSARNGRLLLTGETLNATFDLAGAAFTFGPFQTWPMWPMPMMVEMTAVRARRRTAIG